MPPIPMRVPPSTGVEGMRVVPPVKAPVPAAGDVFVRRMTAENDRQGGHRLFNVPHQFGIGVLVGMGHFHRIGASPLPNSKICNGLPVPAASANMDMLSPVTMKRSAEARSP